MHYVHDGTQSFLYRQVNPIADIFSVSTENKPYS